MNNVTPFRTIRTYYEMSQQEISEKFDIPLKTWQSWESGLRKPPHYILMLISKIFTLEEEVKCLNSICNLLSEMDGSENE